MRVVSRGGLCVLAGVMWLLAGENGTAAAECHKTASVDGRLATEFCIDGNLPQGGHDAFTWTLSKKQSQHPWMWHLRGARGAVTRLEIVSVGGDRPLCTLLDRAPLNEANPRVRRAGESDTIVLRPGRYSLRVSCDGECTGKGDPYQLEAVAAPTTELLGYRREQPLTHQVQSLPDLFALDGDLDGSTDTYAWPMGKRDAATCWQLFLMLPAGERGRVRLYGPDGRLRAQRRTDAHGKAAFADLGLGAGRYRIRIGPAKKGYSPYRLFSAALGTRAIGKDTAGFTQVCPVLKGE